MNRLVAPAIWSKIFKNVKNTESLIGFSQYQWLNPQWHVYTSALCITVITQQFVLSEKFQGFLQAENYGNFTSFIAGTPRIASSFSSKNVYKMFLPVDKTTVKVLW